MALFSADDTNLSSRRCGWFSPSTYGITADLLALCQPAPHILRMSDPVTRLNAGRYRIEAELGEEG